MLYGAEDVDYNRQKEFLRIETLGFRHRHRKQEIFFCWVKSFIVSNDEIGTVEICY